MLWIDFCWYVVLHCLQRDVPPLATIYMNLFLLCLALELWSTMDTAEFEFYPFFVALNMLIIQLLGV